MLEAAQQLRQTIKEDALRTARLHDRINKTLHEAEQSIDAQLGGTSDQLFLPCPIPLPSRGGKTVRKLTKAWITKLRKALGLKLKGITKAARLSLDDFIAWLAEYGLDVMAYWNQALAANPTYDQLKVFWQSHGSPALS